MGNGDITNPGSRAVYGVVRGVVIENKDDHGLGRVRITIPSLAGEVTASWAAVATTVAGRRGSKAVVPEIEDEVLIAFEDGDMDHPIVIGVLRSFD